MCRLSREGCQRLHPTTHLACLYPQLRFDEGFDEEEVPTAPDQLPEWACSYCGVSDAACVAKCITTGKWFCNGRQVSARGRQ